MAAEVDVQRSGLARADAILGAFDAAHCDLSLSGIIARTDIPKSTVYRAVEKMLELGWLEHVGRRYSIGNRLFGLATLSRLRMGLREAALPFMQDLYEATHETVHLAVREGDQVLYAEKISGHRPVTDLSRVGGRMPCHCTGVGKVLLAFAPPDVVDAVIAKDSHHAPHCRSPTRAGFARIWTGCWPTEWATTARNVTLA